MKLEYFIAIVIGKAVNEGQLRKLSNQLINRDMPYRKYNLIVHDSLHKGLGTWWVKPAEEEEVSIYLQAQG